LEYTFFEHGFFSLVYVDPPERRTGAGETLLRHLISACRTSKLFSSTNETNSPVHALFTRLGFKVSGVIQNLDPNNPEMIYYKPLNSRNNAANEYGGVIILERFS
jgi:GNAT superfamily N-acetyltransferase